MKALYIDCFSGISGDMMVGALIDAGASPEKIESELKKLNVSGYEIKCSRVIKEGISSIKFDVIVDEEHSHEHDHHHGHHHHDQNHHEHSHDHGHHHHNHDHSHHENNHAHSHNHDGHHHGHDHSHDGHHHHHHSRYADIVKLIDESELSPKVKERSKQIFAPIAKSESKIHNMSIEDVHFHEVGAVDSIVDIVATAIALEELEIEKITTSHVPLGSGKIRISHGIYPVPAPATLDMMKNVPIAPSDLPYELTTPTGAGIVVSQSDSYGTMPAMKISSIGYGAGTRNIPGRPNVLRVMVGELLEGNEHIVGKQETITVLECHMDDMTGEAFGYVMEKLLKEGALDVYYTPIFMKKNRPGTLVTVLAPENREAKLTEILFKETTTLGVRKNSWSRSILDRNIIVAETAFGPIKIKQALKKGVVIREVPEYEDVKKAALEHGVAFQEVYNATLRTTFN
ncbi:nickel pincer cofactor biosynthesis protein LarC [Bacillus sp. FJAT-49732]|uniref:Pyridinium-3,5-bisthiocarboxylic acid mononucleotide nickel insertion protein n=1 Tax=Lederbergia citrisecunda TaxID=2833583 RepID=A0A942TV23_9BACI|nr:nickel pincer cofactor biosynthesis protein LarC [Lederbergia citrisecunda]MBS4202259.1 nickel pincer cofactor biosynthesis protein LarC [Lederbergia citrisecunda]